MASSAISGGRVSSRIAPKQKRPDCAAQRPSTTTALSASRRHPSRDVRQTGCPILDLVSGLGSFLDLRYQGFLRPFHGPELPLQVSLPMSNLPFRALRSLCPLAPTARPSIHVATSTSARGWLRSHEKEANVQGVRSEWVERGRMARAACKFRTSTPLDQHRQHPATIAATVRAPSVRSSRRSGPKQNPGWLVCLHSGANLLLVVK